MKPLLILALALVFLSSCATTNLTVTKNVTLQNLPVDWTYSNRVDSEYLPNLDSVMLNILYQFNGTKHSFTIHKRLAGEPYGLTFNFGRGKFTGEDEIAVSYLVSALGLIGAPITMLSATDGKGVLFFWYFAADHIQINASLSPELARPNGQSVSGMIQSGATFSNKKARMDRICEGVNDYVYSTLLNLDKNNNTGK